jgi:trehalose 6-phosphate phosphatase
VRAEKKHGIDLLLGKRLTEARAGGVSKGTAAREIAADDPRATVLFAGDDRTDEDAHRALSRRRRAITVKVGPGATQAKHRVRDIAAFREALASVAWYLRA